MAALQALANGAVGAVTLNIVHQAAQLVRPHAPHMDVIGIRALARSMRAASTEPPPRDTLFFLTIAGDLAAAAASRMLDEASS
jgi:hypothetical protein